MKKKNELSVEEAFVKLYVTNLKYVHEGTLLSIKFYENKCNKLINEIDNLKDEEPLKIFKKSHQKWEAKLKQLQKDYEKASDTLFNEYKEFEAILDSYNN